MSQHWPNQVLIVGANTPQMCFCVMCKGNLIRHIKCTCLNPMQWNIWVRRPSLYLKPTVPNISEKISVTHHHIHQSECVWIYIFCTVSYWNKLGSEQITQGHHDDSHTASNTYTSLLTDHRLGNFDFSYHGLSLASIEPQYFEVKILWGVGNGDALRSKGHREAVKNYLADFVR